VPAEARITLLTVAAEKDGAGGPVNPSLELPSGQQTVYLFFRYVNVQPGMEVAFAWYRDGQLLEACSDTWPWSQVEGREWGTNGETYFSCAPSGGWSPGQYRVQVFVQGQEQSVLDFTILP
jgi:hypothetical protein